jgi:2-haloacid dehalogenase
MKVKNIIFDLGGVLIDWNPEYVYLDAFKGNRKKMEKFFDEVCTFDWNENQDAGYPLANATEDRIALFPEQADLIRMYYGRWEEMLRGSISGTVSILKKIVSNNDYRVFALTNWSAETFPIALKRFDFLHWFEGIVVSGTEKTRKPFPEIYETTLERYDLKAFESIFIDDNERNVAVANQLGIQTIKFLNPHQLEKDLKTKEILL